jgi:hypothetical protein
MAKCFWPRHAVRVVDKGQTVDYVICFQCDQLRVHEGSSTRVKPITSEPQPVFNKHLKEAGIPLALGVTGEDNSHASQPVDSPGLRDTFTATARHLLWRS